MTAETNVNFYPDYSRLDPEVLALLGAGRTEGLDHFDNECSRESLQAIRPATFEHLTAAVILSAPRMRPYCGQYVARKNGEEPLPQILPLVDYLLAETYGLMLYREQLAAILDAVAWLPTRLGFDLLEEIDQKNWDVVARWEKTLCEQTVECGTPSERAGEIFRLVKTAVPRTARKVWAMYQAQRLYEQAHHVVHGSGPGKKEAESGRLDQESEAGLWARQDKDG